MAVKGTTHRERQALATRAQVADAARALFAEQGYVATTIAAIARAADIPAPTIYSAFGGKAAILREIADRAVAPLEPMRRHEQALAEPDPAAGLAIAAAVQRDQYEAMYDVIMVFQEAARTDPEIAAATAAILGNRERAFRRHLTAIKGSLRTGVGEAVAVYQALVLPEVYRTLVVEAGWTPARYERWLADALARELLGR